MTHTVSDRTDKEGLYAECSCGWAGTRDRVSVHLAEVERFKEKVQSLGFGVRWQRVNAK